MWGNGEFCFGLGSGEFGHVHMLRGAGSREVEDRRIATSNGLRALRRQKAKAQSLALSRNKETEEAKLGRV